MIARNKRPVCIEAGLNPRSPDQNSRNFVRVHVSYRAFLRARAFRPYFAQPFSPPQEWTEVSMPRPENGLFETQQGYRVIVERRGTELVAEATVKTHINSLLGKLGVTDRTQAATAAIQRGIVPLESLRKPIP